MGSQACEQRPSLPFSACIRQWRVELHSETEIMSLDRYRHRSGFCRSDRLALRLWGSPSHRLGCNRPTGINHDKTLLRGETRKNPSYIVRCNPVSDIWIGCERRRHMPYVPYTIPSSRLLIMPKYR